MVDFRIVCIFDVFMHYAVYYIRISLYFYISAALKGRIDPWEMEHGSTSSLVSYQSSENDEKQIWSLRWKKDNKYMYCCISVSIPWKSHGLYIWYIGISVKQFLFQDLPKNMGMSRCFSGYLYILDASIRTTTIAGAKNPPGQSRSGWWHCCWHSQRRPGEILIKAVQHSETKGPKLGPYVFVCYVLWELCVTWLEGFYSWESLNGNP